MKTKLILASLLLVTAAGACLWWKHTTAITASAITSASALPVKPTDCQANSNGKEIIVSVARQRIWACEAKNIAYESPVITGMQSYASELTPVGDYKISEKLTNQTLAGSDFTGHWSDYVYYWMPFLNNQYGTYGFHDLTASANGANGRVDSDFGNINIRAPYTAAKHGSHGCVELPLPAAKWLHNWASVGTPVSIKN